MADFPIVLSEVVDNTTDVMAKYVNNIEAKLGIGVGTAANAAGGSILTKTDVTGETLWLEPLDSFKRQALLNSNFDVFQRGIITGESWTNPASDSSHMDLYRLSYGYDGGTPPTNIVYSREKLTPGDIPGSFFHLRIAPDGAGTKFGASMYSNYYQKVEHANRYLAGNGKKVTISFYARSSIANKKLGFYLTQNYGTGGTPTAQEVIVGHTWTLTSSWVRYSFTLTTNTHAGKTFGTDNNDHMALVFVLAWGTGTFATRVDSAGVGETFVGAGNIDIAQIQLCAGDIALPYSPKMPLRELADCQAYFIRISSADNAFASFGTGINSTTTTNKPILSLPVTMRADPVFSCSAVDDFVVNHGGTTTQTTNVTADRTTRNVATIVATVASGLTAGDAGTLLANNKTTAFMDFSADL